MKPIQFFYSILDSVFVLLQQSHNEETAVYGDPADRNCRSGLYAEGEEFAVRDASGFYSICRCAHRSAECRGITCSIKFLSWKQKQTISHKKYYQKLTV